jgi:hypothetical protein
MSCKDWSIAVVAEKPMCDICPKFGFIAKVAEYDAKTQFAGNPWAFMCESCYGYFGYDRLGLGYGQRLVPESEHTHEWIEVNLVEYETYEFSQSEPDTTLCSQCGLHKPAE